MGNSLRSSRPVPILIAAGLIALTVVYALVDPAHAWWMPKCPIHLATGFDCPGCGSQRAIHALLHGDIGAAFRHNALLFFMMPYLLLLGFAELTRERHPRLFRVMYHPAFIITVIAIITAWGVCRNL